MTEEQLCVADGYHIWAVQMQWSKYLMLSNDKWRMSSKFGVIMQCYKYLCNKQWQYSNHIGHIYGRDIDTKIT